MLEQYMPEEVQAAVSGFSQLSMSSMYMLMQYRMMNKGQPIQAIEMPLQEAETRFSDLLKMYNEKHPLIFNGSINDLRYFWTSPNIAEKEILSIPNEKVRKTVIEGLNRRCKDGLLEFNSEKRMWLLTEQGKQTVFNEDYILLVFKTDAEYYKNMSENIAEQAELEKNNKQAEFAGDTDININSSEANKQPEYNGDKNVAIENVSESDTSQKKYEISYVAQEEITQEKYDFLTKYDVSRVDFENCIFSDVNITSRPALIGKFEGCRFYRCTFDGFQSESLNMHKSFLTNCTIKDSTFSGVNLSESGIYNTKIINSDLSGADLTAAVLKHSMFSESCNINSANLNSAFIDSVKFDCSAQDVNGLKTAHFTMGGGTEKEVKTYTKRVLQKIGAKGAKIGSKAAKDAASKVVAAGAKAAGTAAKTAVSASVGTATGGISTAVEIAYKCGDALAAPIKRTMGLKRGEK